MFDPQFQRTGLVFGPSNSSKLFVSNSQIVGNGVHGIFVNGAAFQSGVIDRVVIENNTQDGVLFNRLLDREQ
jgi:hypothetical protein